MMTRLFVMLIKGLAVGDWSWAKRTMCLIPPDSAFRFRGVFGLSEPEAERHVKSIQHIE